MKAKRIIVLLFSLVFISLISCGESDNESSKHRKKTSVLNSSNSINDDSSIITTTENESKIKTETDSETTTAATTTPEVTTTTTTEITTTKEEPVKTEADISPAIKSYYEITHLTLIQIYDYDTRQLTYNGLPLLSDDIELIEKTGEIESGIVYRKLAMCLIGFSIGNNWENYARFIIGYTPNSAKEFEPYVENAKNFITTKNVLAAVFDKLDSLSCVDGSIDHNNKKYDITIHDLKKAAEEMQISEECLGYILAGLDEYAVEVELIDVNSVRLIRDI